MKLSKTAIIVLGAGTSTRFGKDNKLVSDFKGRPMVSWITKELNSIDWGQKIFVTGHQAEVITPWIPSSFQIEHNGCFSQGMGSSLARGVKSLAQEIEAAFVVPADMPRLRKNVFLQLISDGQKYPNYKIYRPQYQKKPGHPVLFRRPLFPQLTQLNGDQGGRGIIKSRQEDLMMRVWPTDEVLFDIDNQDRSRDD